MRDVRGLAIKVLGRWCLLHSSHKKLSSLSTRVSVCSSPHLSFHRAVIISQPLPASSYLTHISPPLHNNEPDVYWTCLQYVYFSKIWHFIATYWRASLLCEEYKYAGAREWSQLSSARNHLSCDNLSPPPPSPPPPHVPIKFGYSKHLMPIVSSSLEESLCFQRNRLVETD